MATREETKKMIEVMQAFVDGKEIEATYGFCREGAWFDDYDPSWNWYKNDYKIKKSAPKFKVGDYVRILNGCEIKNYKCGWTSDMDMYVGYIFRIGKVHECNGGFCYTSDVYPYYNYDERGLELVEINNQ